MPAATDCLAAETVGVRDRPQAASRRGQTKNWPRRAPSPVDLRAVPIDLRATAAALRQRLDAHRPTWVAEGLLAFLPRRPRIAAGQHPRPQRPMAAMVAEIFMSSRNAEVMHTRLRNGTTTGLRPHDGLVVRRANAMTSHPIWTGAVGDGAGPVLDRCWPMLVTGAAAQRRSDEKLLLHCTTRCRSSISLHCQKQTSCTAPIVTGTR